jgi:secreted Zn-dependent insulinase-like peptidase
LLHYFHNAGHLFSFCLTFTFYSVNLYLFLLLYVSYDRKFFIVSLQASVAKLETSISLVSDKLELKVYGFNETLPALLSKVLVIAKSFLPSDDRFKVHILWRLVSIDIPMCF